MHTDLFYGTDICTDNRYECKKNRDNGTLSNECFDMEFLVVHWTTNCRKPSCKTDKLTKKLLRKRHIADVKKCRYDE
jgi:hypothetical protein